VVCGCGGGGGGDECGGGDMLCVVVVCGVWFVICGAVDGVQSCWCVAHNDGTGTVFVAVCDLTFKPEVRGAVKRPETADTALHKPVTMLQTAGNFFPVVEG
jgi:hypothetical protein